ncbi:hypothetical protein KTR66_19350 [Roseococcus sp. SDR]|uniref:hypothetical protein n=1 Tax=Roseococcus sp. SDR TaxID=2835532 RepID=UPI001BCD3C59|nr:hypothetical protein [Roseococcus sp. SDR]MBS7792164.1 hypothetical protein [Roseococcus sp. SDR]MBV1847478.1 hypothetical protein [Roseococcus sp. SDR]
MILLAEITGYDAALGAERVLRYATQGWAGPGAPGFYDGRILENPTLRRTAFASGTTGGRIEQGFGELRLANPDGALDGLADFGFDGRNLTLRVGEAHQAYGAFTVLLRGTIEQPTFSELRIAFRIRDRIFELDKPVQEATYAGTNIGASGVEGTADTIKGRRKPRLWGRVLGVSPVLVNAPAQIWQVNDGPISAATMFEGGIAIANGAPYASLAELQAVSPAAGQARAWLAGGLIRLGSSPTLQVTADVDEGAAAADRTAAQVLSRMAAAAGILSGDMVAADVAALDLAAPGQVGVWTNGEGSFISAMEQVAAGVGAWVGFDRLGRLRMRRLEVPAGSPVATLAILDRGSASGPATADIVSLERMPTNDAGRGVPAWRVTLSYGRIWTPLERDALALGVSDARAAFLREPVRNAVAENAAVKSKHLQANDLAFESLLVSEADAQAEAARRLVMFASRRDRLRVRVVTRPDMLAAIDLGAIVSVATHRYGYASGRLMVVTGIEMGADGWGRPDVLTLDLWG